MISELSELESLVLRAGSLINEKKKRSTFVLQYFDQKQSACLVL